MRLSFAVTFVGVKEVEGLLDLVLLILGQFPSAPPLSLRLVKVFQLRPQRQRHFSYNVAQCQVIYPLQYNLVFIDYKVRSYYE